MEWYTLAMQAKRLRSLSSPAVMFSPLALAVVVVVAVPVGGMDLPQQQGILTAFAFGVALCIYGVAAVFKSHISFHSAVLLGVPLVVVGAVSSIQTQSVIHSVFGTSFETGTVGSLVLFAAAIAVGVCAPARAARWFLYTYLLAGVVSALGALFLWSGIEVFKPLGGMWPHLSYVLSSGALIAAILFDRDGPGRRRGLYGAATLILVAGLLVVFNPVAAGIGVSAGLIIVVFTVISDVESGLLRFSLATTLVSVLMVVFIVFTPGQLPATTAVARPSLLATELVTGRLYLSSLEAALIGTGPHSFSYAWSAYRPEEINMTPLWNFEPSSGYSTLTTLAVTIGMLGLLALFLGPGVLVLRLITKEGGEFLARITAEDRGVFEACLLLCLFLFLSMIWYPVGLPLFVMAGLTLGFSLRFLFIQEHDAGGELRPWIRYSIVAVLAGAGAVFLWVPAHQAAGAWYHGRATAVLSVDVRKVADAAPLFEKAAAAWPSAKYLLDAANADAAVAFDLMKSSAQGNGAETAGVAALLNKAVTYSERATEENPRDFTVWLSRAALYISLSQFAFPDALTRADEALGVARNLAPMDPRVPYTHALLNRAKGDTAGAAADIRQALELKPDYEDALKWGSQK